MEGKQKGTWFDDDPEWDDLRKRIEGQPVPKNKKRPKPKHKLQKPSEPSKNSSEAPKKVELSVNVTLPRPALPKLSKLTRKHRVIAASGAGVLLVILVAYWLVTNVFSNDPKTGAPAAQLATEPTFDTVLPDGKAEETSSGKLGYDPKRQVASFEDAIGLAKLTVSQQPLPENFKANPDEEVRKLAESFSAKEVIAESTPKAYLGTDEKGPQTAIFHKNGLLIFILSSKTLDKSQWAEYITKLQ